MNLYKPCKFFNPENKIGGEKKKEKVAKYLCISILNLTTEFRQCRYLLDPKKKKKKKRTNPPKKHVFGKKKRNPVGVGTRGGVHNFPQNNACSCPPPPPFPFLGVSFRQGGGGDGGLFLFWGWGWGWVSIK